MTTERVLDKLTKLKAAREGEAQLGNMAAAEAFASAINCLLLQHELSEADIPLDQKAEEPIVELLVNAGQFGIPFMKMRCGWQEALARIVACAHLCKFLVTSGTNRITFVGTKAHMTVAEYAYGVLASTAAKMSADARDDWWKRECGGRHLASGNFRAAWLMGFIERIAERFEEAKRVEVKAAVDSHMATSTNTALVRLDNALARVDRYVGDKYKRKASGTSMRTRTERHQPVGTEGNTIAHSRRNPAARSGQKEHRQMELFQAHQQWSTRPNDERFSSLHSLYDATKAYAATAIERPEVRVDSLRVEALDGEVQLLGKGNVPARLTHWSFGQLAARVNAPAGYLRELPATLAAQNLNHGLARRIKDDGDATANLLLHQNGSLLLRAVTTDKYSRIWNWEVAERLLEMEQRGWTPATPDVRRIDERLPLYASDHDMFAFIMHPDRIIKESGNPLGLKRGLIASNSEVGAGKLRLLRFLYREMCGNHIIWGAEDVVDLSAVHVGDIRRKFSSWQLSITRYLDESAASDEQRIASAQTKRLAATKDELLDLLFGKKSLGLTRQMIEAGYAAVQDGDGDPLTPWGIAQGLTRHSQTTPYADERMRIDKAAGRLLEAF